VDAMRTKHEEQRPLLAQIMKKKLRRRAKKQGPILLNNFGLNLFGPIFTLQ
jgi:hypothetical protein